MDGFAVCQRLKADPSTALVPIIFLTGERGVDSKVRGFDLGGVDYVTKPFNPIELAPLVRSLLERVGAGERDDVRREKLTELRSLLERE